MSYFVSETKNPILSCECMVCLDPIVDSPYISFCECGHKLHLDCLNDWTNIKYPDLIYSYICPVCNCLRDIDVEKSILEIELHTDNKKFIINKIPILKKFNKCFNKLFRKNNP